MHMSPPPVAQGLSALSHFPEQVSHMHGLLHPVCVSVNVCWRVRWCVGCAYVLCSRRAASHVDSPCGLCLCARRCACLGFCRSVLVQASASLRTACGTVRRIRRVVNMSSTLRCKCASVLVFSSPRSVRFSFEACRCHCVASSRRHPSQWLARQRRAHEGIRCRLDGEKRSASARQRHESCAAAVVFFRRAKVLRKCRGLGILFVTSIFVHPTALRSSGRRRKTTE